MCLCVFALMSAAADVPYTVARNKSVFVLDAARSRFHTLIDLFFTGHFFYKLPSTALSYTFRCQF